MSSLSKYVVSASDELVNHSCYYDSLLLELNTSYRNIVHSGFTFINQAVACKPSFGYYNTYDSIDICATPSYDGQQSDGSSILPYLESIEGDSILSKEDVIPSGYNLEGPYGTWLKLNKQPHLSGYYKFIIRLYING